MREERSSIECSQNYFPQPMIWSFVGKNGCVLERAFERFSSLLRVNEITGMLKCIALFL